MLKNYRYVEYYSPQKHQDQNLIDYNKSLVPSSNRTMTIYETVKIYEKKIFHHLGMTPINNFPRIFIRTLINIHNDDGIKNMSQIAHFFSKIKKGENILQPGGLPNIKLARLKLKDFLVFDGHHSLLAYMAAGKIFLDEIPHIIVSGKKGFLKNKEILVFWGQHAYKIPAKDWKLFVINWQNPENKQICPRIQRNMGELFDALLEKISSTMKNSTT